MKAVVTGGMGFIGSHLVDALLAQGAKVLVIDNLSIGRKKNLAHHAQNPNLEFKQKDISDDGANLAEDFLDADYIFHLAALADIVPSVKNPVKYYEANVNGTLKVLEAVREVQEKSKRLKKLFYAASSSCYGLAEEYPTPESASIMPEYPYALTKRLGEELVLHWGKLYKIPVVSCRFFNVYGPRARTNGTYGAVFGVFLAQILNKKPCTIVGDGKQTRDFTYVTDVVDGIMAASFSAITQEIFNIGSGGTYEINELVDLLGGEKTYIPKRPGEPDCTFADVSKIERLIGWRSKISFADGIKQMLKSIDDFQDAPVWTPESIADATKEWYEALS